MSADNPGDGAPQAHLFMIRPGPSYRADEFEPLCATLSARFSGEIWVPGSYAADLMMGRMRLRVVKEPFASPIRNFVDFARKICSRIEEIRRQPRNSTVIMTYDPFRSGLLGRWAAAQLDAPFLCEVNGIYGDPTNLADIHPVWLRRLRLAWMRSLGSIVLPGASAVKLLFDRQLEGFAQPSPRAVVRSFMDFCNTERFYPGAEEPIILSAGYPFRRKGYDILCSAFARIAPRFPDWKLVLIGHTIPTEARSAGFVDPRIELLPGVPQSEIAAWISRCAIFALASRSEAMGRVLIEAASAGKCRLASRVGGIPTVIEDGVDGLLFENENVTELSERLATLMADVDLRKRLGSAAQRRAATEFSPAAYLARYSELIEATIARTSRAPNSTAA